MSLYPTPHSPYGAEKGEIGDNPASRRPPEGQSILPEHFLEDVKQFNRTRNMLGYTGTYMGRPGICMGTGMGCPSIGYSYELIHFGCKNLIRWARQGPDAGRPCERHGVCHGSLYHQAILCACWGFRAIIRRCAAQPVGAGVAAARSGDCPFMWAMCSAQTCSMPRPNRCREE